VEEGVLHIEWLNRPGARCGESEHRADGGRFHNRAESLVVFHPGALSEAPENPASLVAVKSPIREELVCEDPLAGDEPQGRGTSSHVPMLIRAPYSSSIAVCQFGSARAGVREVGMVEGGDKEAVATGVN
jgi:hypothetical protein